MCINFKSALRAEIEAIIADDIQGDLYQSHEVFPRYTAPIIRRDQSTGRPRADLATFGLLPYWAKDPKPAYSTMNARSETVATLPSFRDAWRKGQMCLVPVKHYYENKHQTGAAVRWSIGRNDADHFALAGLWSWWPGRGEHEARLSFTMLTVNCDRHSVLNQFHRPEDQKRALVQIAPSEYTAWLDAGPELARAMLELPPAECLSVAAAPLPPRTSAGRRSNPEPLV